MVSYILITGYSILLFMNPLNFVAVILKVLLVNLLAALNFANVWKIQKNVKNVFLHQWLSGLLGMCNMSIITLPFSRQWVIYCIHISMSSHQWLRRKGAKLR